MKTSYTPDNITSLAPHEVFVFGSNLAGAHAGGAARVAARKFGAVWGQGEGLQGQSYAIPTMQGGVETIHCRLQRERYSPIVYPRSGYKKYRPSTRVCRDYRSGPTVDTPPENFVINPL